MILLVVFAACLAISAASHKSLHPYGLSDQIKVYTIWCIVNTIWCIVNTIWCIVNTIWCIVFNSNFDVRYCKIKVQQVCRVLAWSFYATYDKLKQQPCRQAKHSVER